MNKILVCIFFIGSFFILSCKSDYELRSFLIEYSGIWDTEDNLLNDPGYNILMSWGESNISITSSLIIEVESYIDPKRLNNTIEFDNEGYLIKDVTHLKENVYLLLLEEVNDSELFPNHQGYYLFKTDIERQKLEIIPIIKLDEDLLLSIKNQVNLGKNLDSIPDIDFFKSIKLYKRSGPNQITP